MAEQEQEAINPYAPTVSTESIQNELSRESADVDDYVPSSFAWTAFRWFMVCLISAVPSFFVGMALTEGRYPAMLTGILIFSVLYTLADYFTARQSWRRNKLVRRTLKTMYGTRVAISIIFPVGYFLDVFCGFVSINLSQTITGSGFTQDNLSSQFGDVLAITLIHGCVMNAVLGVYGLVILTFSTLVVFLRR